MEIDESLTARRFTPAADVPNRTHEYIEIHHWGDRGQTHDGVNRFFVNTAETSAHFVASDGRVTCLVNPDDVAWHAGNWSWNLRTIGIECRPEATDGDYRTVAELVRYLRNIYGDLPLIPHRQTSNTACPGVWDLARIDREARQTITEQEESMSAQEVKQIIEFVQAAHDVTRAHVIKEVNQFTQDASDVTRGYLADRVREADDPDVIVSLIPQEIAQLVIDGLAKRLAE